MTLCLHLQLVVLPRRAIPPTAALGLEILRASTVQDIQLLGQTEIDSAAALPLLCTVVSAGFASVTLHVTDTRACMSGRFIYTHMSLPMCKQEHGG